jgi:GNAT superfamily N-acetyltransferase
MSEFLVRPITEAETRPLRSQVLRPGVPPEQLVYHGDDSAESFHAGAFTDGKLASIASVYREPMPGSTPGDPRHDSAFRLRGMATLPELRGRGLGAAVLQSCLLHVASRGATILWCNARTGALGYYLKLGFTTEGEEFEIEGIGPHYVMWRTVVD